LAFAPDGRLITASGDGTARVWDLKNPAAPQAILEGEKSGIHTVAFAPDGRLVAGGEAGTLLIWDLNDPTKRPIPLRGQRTKVIALKFAPDSRLVTAGLQDPDARVWDLREPAAQPLILHGTGSGVSTLEFGPDGRLVICGEDGTVRVWNLELDHAIEVAKVVSGRNLTAEEWEQFFGKAPYHRTFATLPDGAGAKEAPATQDASDSGTPDASRRPVATRG
jgi:WD40 repeat protein